MLNLNKYKYKQDLTIKDKMAIKSEYKRLEREINKLRHKLSKVELIILKYGTTSGGTFFKE